MFDIHIDAYSSEEMARRVEKIGVKKAKANTIKTLVLSFLAGFFIALGAEFYTVVVHDSVFPLGITKLIGGLAFCLGLILVIGAGAELFTGNSLIIMAYVQNKINLYELLRNWFWVFIGNFIGSLGMVVLMYLSNQYAANNYLLGAKIVAIAQSKVDMGFVEAFVKGILCNILVALAVWLSFGGRSATDKIIGIIFPITAFVASGFEHCVANMYFIPMGMVLARVPAVTSTLGKSVESLSPANFFIGNLLPVTLGNIIGGAVFVGLVYWFVYLRGNDPGIV